MAFSFRKIFEGLNIVPRSSTSANAKGDIEVISGTTKLQYHNGTTVSPVVTETHASQGTNRLKDKDLEAGSTKLVDASDVTKKVAFDISGGTTAKTLTISASVTDDRTLTLPNATDTLVGKATTDTLTNKTFDADGTGNSITNIENADIKAGAAIDRTKLASGTASHVLINNGSGVMSSEAALAVSRGGTNSGTALNNSRVMHSSGGAIVESSVTSTELGYVSGVTSAIQTQIDNLVAGFLPPGITVPYSGTAAPSGWLMCDGAEVSQATYANLYAILGSTYNTGGEAGGNFRVPDLRGRAVAGKDDMGGSAASRITNAVSGITATTLGAAGGSQSHTLTSAEMPTHTHTQDAHSHGVSDPQHAHSTGWGAGGSGTAYPEEPYISDIYGGAAANTGSAATGITIQNATATNQNTGGGGAHRNVQPTMILNYIIKV